ncbi:transposase [Streptomyces yokosukanensis]
MAQGRLADRFKSTCGRVAPLLPPTPAWGHHRPGRLRVPDRAAFAGVMYVLRTAVAWRDVPAETDRWRRA